MPSRSLHVVVDGRELAGQPTGVGRYVFNILRSWADDRSNGHRFSVILSAPATPEMQSLGERFTWVHEPARSHGTRWEQTRLVKLAAELEPDVFFAAGYTAPLRLRCPYVLAVYDVSFFAHPEWFRAREGLRRRLITRAAARRAHSVITISEFSAREIERYLGVARAQIQIAPPGSPVPASPVVRLSRGTEVDLWKTPSSIDRRELGVFHRSTSVPCVLYVGSLFTRRHIPELIEGFAQAAAQVPARLVLVGDNRISRRSTLRRSPRASASAISWSWRRYVSDQDLEQLYATAGVFAFLSEYEGFAMTPMEALAHDVPVVLLDTEVAREVYDDAARYVSLDVASIGQAMVELLADAASRDRLLSAGRRRLAMYSWTRSADVIRRALEAAAGS